eukprot:m.226809 g.226809  ORF g.226809 m.226809 type:complete len:906 (-) comp33502_c0_seq2:307-3024(-)
MSLRHTVLKPTSSTWSKSPQGSPRAQRPTDRYSPKSSPQGTPPSTLNRGERVGNKRYAPDNSDFRIEDGSETSPLVDRAALMGNILLENPEIETRWYFKYFLGQTHKNYIVFLTSLDGELEPALLSLFIEEADDVAVRAILWRRTGSERLCTRIPKGKPIIPKRFIANFGHGPPENKLSEIKDATIQDLLLVLEEQEGAVHFKFGVLYAKPGQTTDDEMFSNENGSPAFTEFYKVLGKLSPQKGFSGWRAGLDVNNGTTGDDMVHATEFGKEIVFHVSTLLPWSSTNPQQVERKRHLGNNVCNIIFLEDAEDVEEDQETPFLVDKFASQFTHIFAVVWPKKDGRYKLKVFTKNTVPEYGPPLPNPAIFENLEELRHFLIVKLLNGEKSTLSSPISSFANKKERTLEALISGIHEKFDRKRTLTRRTSSGPKVYGRERVELFRSKGQSIKMNKIAMGVAPTSARSTSQLKGPGMEPWTPICITSNLKQQIVAGDSWGEDFVGSSAFGVTRFFVDQHMSGELESVVLIDSSIAIVQLHIDEEIEILFCRSSSSVDDSMDARNGQVYAIPLDVFLHRETPLSKKELTKLYAVPRTKGATIYSIHMAAPSTASILQNACKMAVAVGKKLRTFRFIPANPARVPGMGTGGTFEMLHEYPTADSIQALVIGEPCSTGQQVSCALTSGTFALINIESGLETPLALDESAIQVKPVMCLQVADPIDSLQQEFVICFNQSVEFKHSNGHNSRQYDVRMSASPHAIAYVYPYLLGFTKDSIEVVTMINGSLVKTMPMQRCRFLGSKKGVYFTSTGTQDGTTMLYKMSEDTLSGKTTVDGTLGQFQQQVAPGNVFVRRMSVNKMSREVALAQDRVQDRRTSTSPRRSSNTTGVTRISEEVENSNRRNNPLFEEGDF